MVRVFANGLGGRGTIPGRVIPKTLKTFLDTSLLNTQHYKVWINDKWCNPEKGITPSLYLGVIAIKKEPSGCPQLSSANLYIYARIIK